MTPLRGRQIHLDFHTSEHIPGIAQDFCAKDFAQTMLEASVDSATVFARCHHGWLYYDSKAFPELVHPHLCNKNLLIEQVSALHEAGIRAPVYITVQWDLQSSSKHPEWLVRDKFGAHEGGPFEAPGFYQSLCINTGYVDFLKAQTKEVCELLGDQLDGIFFDIVGIRPCHCAACRGEMKKLGIDAADDEAVRRFTKMSLDRFKADMSAFVRQYSTDCTIFYNAGHVGPCTKESRDAYTHFELESLPSDGWGYLHFPVAARYAKTLGKDCMGMTGKFHTGWGDFHSLKNQAALEFECFRMLSMGFACSIGDQLEPRGTLGKATYRLIGNVYGQVKTYEPWARAAVPVVEAAVLTDETIWAESAIPASVLGATQLLEELAISFDIVDSQQSLSHYKLVIVPDGFRCDDAFQARLDEYAQNGGAVIACADGALSDGRYPHCFGLDHLGKQPLYPDFLIAEGPLADGLDEGNEYVIYMQGERAEATTAAPLMFARAPYFARQGDKFCSHKYTPSAKGDDYPAAFRNGSVITFTHPLFAQYRENAPHWCKQLVSNAIDGLLPARIIRHDGPSTLRATLLHQPEHRRYAAHILCYIPVRKSATIDLVEERTAYRDLTLEIHVDHKLSSATLVPSGEALALHGNKLTLPLVDGYAVVQLNYE